MGKESNQQKPSQTIRVVNLGKRLDVYVLLFQTFEFYLEDTCRHFEKQPGKMLSSGLKGLAERDVTLANGLFNVFAGLDPHGTIPAAGWTGAPLGRKLRTIFAPDLIGLKEDDAALFEDDVNVIFFAMMRLVDQMREISGQFMGKDHDLEKEGRRLHEFCSRWSAILSNSSEPLPEPGDLKQAVETDRKG